MKLIYCIYSTFIIVLVLSSCGPASSTALPTQAVVVIQPPTSTFVQPTITSILAPTETATLVPPATLQPEKAQLTMRVRLQQPIDCDAPCFWGISPEQTTLDEAKYIFTRLGLLLEYTNTLNGEDFYESAYDFESGLSVSMLLGIQNNVIKDLTIYLEPEKEDPGVSREWSAYSPETLIKRYGLPSRVDLFVGRGPKPSYFFDMYFDTVDLIIRYHSYEVNSKLRLCPLRDQFDSVQIWLGKDPVYPPIRDPAILSLEDATSLTMEEFSNLMTGDPKKACFNLKEEAFPQ